jgi:hypothetical protein
MIVKHERESRSFYKKISLGRKRLKNLSTVSLYIVNLLIVFFLATIFVVKPDALNNGFKKIYNIAYSKNYIHYPRAMLLYLKSKFIIPEYVQINIKHMDMQKLEYERQRKLNQKPKVDSGNYFKYVSAGIEHNRQNYRAKVRLKGDREIHYNDIKKLSFRVDLKGADNLWGMKKFSLHKPRARNYIYEWLVLEMMKYEGIIAPKYKFINLNLNGKDLGIYALEEHYNKFLLERYRHREGPIVRFNESFSTNYKKSVVTPYEKKKWSSPENLPITERAIHLLEKFSHGKTGPEEVFELSKLANFYAILDLFVAHHGYYTKSLRYYYNPLIGKLEPIPFDNHYVHEKHYQLEKGLPFGESFFIASERAINPAPGNSVYYQYEPYKQYMKLLFNNDETFSTEFFKKYIEALKKYSKSEYLDKFFLSIKNQLDYNLKMIYKNFPLEDNNSYYGPGPFVFNESVVYRNQQKLQEKLEDYKHSNINTRVHWLALDSENLTLEVVNRGWMPVKIIKATCGNTNFFPVTKAIIVANDLRKIRKIKFKIPKNYNVNDLKKNCLTISYKIIGLEIEKEEEVFPWKMFKKAGQAGHILSKSENINQFNFLEVDRKRNKILIKPGHWEIKESLVIPPQYKFIVSSGTQINLKNNAVILSYSPVEFLGTKESPIIIRSEDNSGQGLVVLQAKTKSIIKYTQFVNLKNANKVGWKLTGAVTFYESPVEIYHSSFSKNNSEDSLNIVRSNFVIKDSIFDHAFSDALDIDFGNGIIENSKFEYLGNDAIDMSGSKVDLKNIEIKFAGDKGISAGEKSDVRADAIFISASKNAIASKDHSHVLIEDIHLKDVAVGFSIYQKKPEFGPGKVLVNRLVSENTSVLYLLEKGSHLFVDGLEMLDKQPDVEKTLYSLSNN